VLPFLKENRYSRLELTAELIGARAHERLDDLDQARELATQVLRMADSLGDEDQWASAASSLASILSSLGRYPEALRLRDRAAAIHLRQGDNAALPYDLGNRADLLIRLNRPAEAGLLLDQIDRGIQAGRESFGGRRRRLLFLRAFAAVTALRCADAMPKLQELQAEGKADDTAASLGPALQAFCNPRLAGVPKRDETDPPLARERQYWFAAAALRRRDPESALAEAERGLQLLGERTNDELRWRLAAAAAIGSRQRGDDEGAGRYSRAADEALQRLTQAYQADFTTYAQRPDLVELKKREQN
jgi:tetratricopeptide (TPR) repeat protein